MKILGIDPGKTNCAICLLEEQQFQTWKIETGKTESYFTPVVQLIRLEVELDSIFTKYKPNVMFHEGISFMEKFGVAESGKVDYIIQRTAVNHGVNFFTIPPLTIRRFLKIKGKSKGKTDITMAVYKLFGFEHEDQNQIDAFAIAKCGEAMLRGEFQLTAPKTIKKGK